MKQENSMSRQSRKLWIMVNYLSIILILSFFYAGKYYDWLALVLVGEAVSVLLFVVSFVKVYIKARLWKITHT